LANLRQDLKHVDDSGHLVDDLNVIEIRGILLRRLRNSKEPWRKRALDATFSGQSFGSMGIAAVLIGHGNILRIDPTVPAGMFSLDDCRKLTELEGLAREHAREQLPRFRVLFDHGPAESFKPLYGPLS